MRAERRAAESFGRRAERLCVLALWLKGYRVLARRFRAAGGEIDIVAARGRTVAFVEVKARPTEAAAIEAVGPAQRRRIEHAARMFLAAHPATLGGSGGRAAGRRRLGAPARDVTVRFDVMTVVPRRWPRHVENAWQSDAIG